MNGNTIVRIVLLIAIWLFAIICGILIYGNYIGLKVVWSTWLIAIGGMLFFSYKLLTYKDKIDRDPIFRIRRERRVRL